LEKFEEQFFNELRNQHDRVDLFVKSKSFEINSRLSQATHPQQCIAIANSIPEQAERQVIALLRTATWRDGNSLTHSQRDRFGKYDRKITR
jgi:hypothetical protein